MLRMGRCGFPTGTNEGQVQKHSYALAKVIKVTLLLGFVGKIEMNRAKESPNLKLGSSLIVTFPVVLK